MTRSAPLLVASLFVFGCGGSTPAPAAPPAEAAASPIPAALPTPEPAASADKPGSDGWEGEGDAKGTSTPAAEPTPTPVAAKGKTETRTIEVIQKIVKDHRQPVRDCYEKARKDIPSLQGDLMIHFVLDPDGKVKSIELNQERSTLKSPEVVSCAISTIKGLTFPPSSRGMESVVNYPYNFMPGGPPRH